MLSKTFFAKLAKDYADARPDIADDDRYATWLHMVYLTANRMRVSAERFDMQKFLAACGIEEHAPASAG